MTVATWTRSLAATLAVIGVLLSCGATPLRAQAITPALEGTLKPMAPATEPVVLEGTLSEYFIYLPQLAVPAGTVRFVVENVGVQRHNLRVVGNGVDQTTPDLRAGQSGEVEVLFVDSGPYTVYCDIGDHADQGMAIGLYVEAPFTET